MNPHVGTSGSDERRFQRLFDKALERIPVHSPEWTDYNHSDPGVTLIQLFAWLAENLLYRIDQIPEFRRSAFRRVAARVELRSRCPRLLVRGGNRTSRSAAARFIASKLGLELYRIDLSRVVNQYIGETEKKLGQLFASAKDTGAILFFDEADALFGSRTEVKDSHGRYSAQAIDWLLRRLARHRGLVILATDRKEKPPGRRWRKLQCDVSSLARGRLVPPRSADTLSR